MASNHMPSDQVPLQGQNIYSDPSYSNFFPSNVERYGTPSWEAQLHQSSGLTSGSTHQNWAGTYPQQTFNSQPYGAQPQAFRTASPYQYAQFNQHGSTPTFGHSTPVDPSLGLNPTALRQQQQSPYQVPVRNATPSNQSSTVTPQALQQNLSTLQNAASPFQAPKNTVDQVTQQPVTSTVAKPVRNPVYEVPKGKKSGGLYVIDIASLAKATNSIPLNKLVALGTEPIQLVTNRTALPLYTARQSIKELKKIGADNKKLLAKLSSSKSSLSRAIKFSKTNAGGTGGLKREVSDSEDYTESSDDDSEYSDSEDEEVSPLPTLRPDDDPHKAVCYDVIKASWFPRRSPLNSEKIKNSMRDLWDVMNTIQKRWRADSKAVTEAEEAKKIGELPTLKSRVTSQRDLLQSALKAALEHAHPDVLYHLGQVKPFLYLCYQFLANRFKAKDYDGPLPSAIYEVLAQCGTLTTELIEETKVSKALVSMKKQANDKNKAFIQQIVEAAAAGSKKVKHSPPAAETNEAKGAKRPASEAATGATGEGSSVKKPKPGESAAPAVKAASGTTKPPANASMLKRPGEKPVGAPAPVRARVSPAANKSTNIFASLNAAAKKPAAAATAPVATKLNVQAKGATTAAKEKKPAPAPTKPSGFSFASTMAALTKPKEPESAPTKTEKDVPNETPEQKAKRLRKESRRHLRVTFRPDASLVAIKYFSHDPEEELGHDENFTRDAGDLGGEGHMFKQHKELEEDDDDDDDETDYRAWTEPSQVDFSVVDPEERKRNYVPYGGGENVPTCPEKEANMRRENDILMVFYTSPGDIPPSPHEPPEQAEDGAATVTMFGTPPDKCLERAPKPAVTTTAAPALDISSLESIIAQFANQNQTMAAAAVPAAAPAPPVQTTYTPPASSAAPAVDLASLLASLQQQAPAAPAAPAPSVASQFPTLPAGMPPPPPGAPPAELAAFLAVMQGQGGPGAMPPMPPGFPPLGFPGGPFGFTPQGGQGPDGSGYQGQGQEGYYQQDYQQEYQQEYQQSNGGTKRPRDEGNNNDRGGQGKKHKVGGKPHKVLACKFYQKGTCNKGDNCTYIHDVGM